MLYVDTREKPDAIKNILRTFDKSGVEYEIKKLDVGDYWTDSNPKIAVDRKQNLGELCTNLFSPHDRGRFWREWKRAHEAGIHLIILCEHGGKIKRIDDVGNWVNKYGRVSGHDLKEKIYAAHRSYNIDFIFCDKRTTGKKILELLGIFKG